MAVIQEAFDIPSDIMTKLLTGEYRRLGGVIRVAEGPNKGQIVKHLKPLDIKDAGRVQKSGTTIIKYPVDKKGVLIIVGSLIAVATVCAAYIVNIKFRELAVLTSFRSMLKRYLNEIRHGNLTIETINRLLSSLDELKRHKNYEAFKIELSADDLEVFVNRIYDYTILLAENNHVELSEDERTKSSNSIINLQSYLRTQKRIFESVA